MESFSCATGDSGMKKKKKSPYYINRLSSFNRYEAACFEFANVLFRLWCSWLACSGCFCKGCETFKLSNFSMWGFLFTLNLHLLSGALIPRLYSSRRTLCVVLWEAVHEVFEAQWDKRRNTVQTNCRVVVHIYPGPKIFMCYATLHE